MVTRRCFYRCAVVMLPARLSDFEVALCGEARSNPSNGRSVFGREGRKGRGTEGNAASNSGGRRWVSSAFEGG